MKDRSHSLAGLPPNLFIRVDALCGRFETDLQAGKRLIQFYDLSIDARPHETAGL